MSVIKVVLADDTHLLSATLHGSDAELIYAHCAATPRTLKQLDQTIQRSAGRSLEQLFCLSEDLTLEPIDAGLIIIDLARKWVYAQDSYFGSPRSGVWRSSEMSIPYEFSEEWRFVFDPKWFRYLQSSALQRYIEEDDSEFPDSDDDFWNEELAAIEVTYANRVCSLIDFKPADEAEKRDFKIVELILEHDQQARVAAQRIKEGESEIVSLQILLEAVENVSRHDLEPRWAQRQKALQEDIEQARNRVLHHRDRQSEAEQLATALRNMLTTDRFRTLVDEWQER